MDKINRLNIALKEAFKQHDIYKKGDMAKFLGYRSTYFSGIINGKEKMSDIFLNNISEKLGVNIDWIKFGKGEMLYNSILKPQKAYGDPEYQSDDTIPLLPLSAQAGSLNNFVLSVKNFDCERIISPIKGADFAISVSGDSMFPEYPSGAQVLIKKINEKAFIDWGRVFVLDTCNGTIIKKLMPSDDPSKVMCVSINPAYPSYEISLENVYGIYKVMMCMAMK